MADNIKIIGNVNNIERVTRLKLEDINLLQPQIQNQTFGFDNDYIEYFIYDTGGNLIYSNYSYKDVKLPSNSYLNPSSTLPVIEIDPIQDLQNLGYISGEYITQYNFQTRKISNPSAELFISKISEDRTEIKVKSTLISSTDLLAKGNELILDLENTSYQKYYLLNLSSNLQFTIVNVAIDTTDSSVLFKLYEPLPQNISEKNTLWITEEIIQPYIFGLNLDASVIPLEGPKLRGPNFDINLNFKENIDTGYVNFSNLVTSLTGSSYHQVLNYMNDNSYDLNIDYTSFTNFIHFSSAKKRVNVFYDKIKQIEDYNNNINIITGSTNLLKNEQTSSIKLKIDNIIKNFDGFERYLYFESSSYAWPKLGDNKPYILLSTGSTTTRTWYDNYTGSAELYDDNNLDHLYNIIPEYIKNDPDGYQPYYDFIDMIGHYFDNIWIYITSINELYNADNNLEKGVSKDIIYDALTSLGVKLYNSKGDDDFTDYINGSNIGSTLFVDDFSVTSSYLNNIPKKDLLAETFKRIYHNIPLLTKTKGTSTGLKNLINTFGVTGSILSPKEFGGSTKRNEIKGYDNDKITIQNNTITGSVLSPFISLQNSPTSSAEFTSTDLHFIDLSFSPQNELNTRISSSIASTYPTFSLDEYIGDPRLMESSSYDALINQQNYFVSASSAISGSTQRLDYKGFIELVKYFDNSLFKMLKDFVPARTNALTGITIKSPVLERNKISVNHPKVSEENVYDANYKGPVISEDRGYYYDDIEGNKTVFYTGEFTGSYANINDVFENSNPNGYLHPTNSIDINQFNHTDFNVTLNNVTSSVLSSNRFKLENINTTINDEVFKTTSQCISQVELQDSYESLLGHNHSRYEGTKLTSLTYNTYSSSSYIGSDGITVQYGDISFGKTAVIDYYTNKLGLFTQIIENPLFPSSKRNNVSLKYLVDIDGNLTELNKRNKHWEEVQNIFKSGESLVVSLFDNQTTSNQKRTDGVKPIYNSGYNYTPMLYFTGSSSTDKLYFSYSGEDVLKLFNAKNTVSGYISGSNSLSYPLKPSASAYVIYNIFDSVVLNDNSLYTAGSSTFNTFPSYSVAANGNYTFNTNFDLNIKFPTSNQSCSFVYEVIKGGIDGNGWPTGSTLSTSGIKTFTTSYQYLVYTRGYNIIPEGATITNHTSAPISSTYFPLYVGDNLLLTYVSSNQYSDGSNSWYSFIVDWDLGGYTTTSLIFSKDPTPFYFSNDDYITTVSNVSSIFNQTEGVLPFIINSSGDDLIKGDHVYFKLSLLESSSPNFTASFATAGELKNNLTSNIAGNAVYATGSASDSFIVSAISSSNGNIDTLVFNYGLSAFNNYTFLPTTGSADLLKLYNTYGSVSDSFSPTPGDIVVTYWDGQSTEFNVVNAFVSGSYRCLTLDRNIPSSLLNKITSGGDTTTAGLDQFVLLKKNKDETNTILNFTKPSGSTSLGFIIPNNIHPDVLNNIDIITKEVKQKIINMG